MGIEQLLERIAVALEENNQLTARGIAVAEWNRDRLSLPDAPAIPAARKSPTEEAASGQELSYEEKKALLESLGVTVPRGTKTTTLNKWLAEAQTRPASAAAAEEAPEPTPEAAEEGAADPFGVEEPVVEAAPTEPPMTYEEAVNVIKANYNREKDAGLVRQVFATFGVADLRDERVAPKLREVVAEYLRLKAAAK